MRGSLRLVMTMVCSSDEYQRSLVITMGLALPIAPAGIVRVMRVPSACTPLIVCVPSEVVVRLLLVVSQFPLRRAAAVGAAPIIRACHRPALHLSRDLSIRLKDVLGTGHVIVDEHHVRSSLPGGCPGADRRQSHIAARAALAIAGDRASGGALDAIAVGEDCVVCVENVALNGAPVTVLPPNPLEADEADSVIRHRAGPTMMSWTPRGGVTASVCADAIPATARTASRSEPA